jgi:hypothetical protein
MIANLIPGTRVRVPTFRLSVAILFVAVTGVFHAGEAEAQLFGSRDIGRSVTRRARPSLSTRAADGNGSSTNASGSSRAGAGATGEARAPLESIGTMVDEGARYVRGNREATDFVGADTAEAERFVGALQSGAGELIQSAVEEQLEIETAEDANQVIEPVLPPRMLLTPPRLQLGFSAPARPSVEMSATVLQHLQAALPSLDPNWFEVSVAEGVATLRGTVASERDRKMAALLVGFEPGIARVQNELTVAMPVRQEDVPPAAPAIRLPPRPTDLR